MKRGAIILCGGKSSRMGRDKAMLPFGPELMLQRVVRLIAEVVPVENIVVVAAANQSLPQLPEQIRVARDEIAYRGPLGGIAVGIQALGDCVLDAIYVSGCDAPLFKPQFAARLFELMSSREAVAPYTVEHVYPLVAVYRPTVLPHINRMIAAGQSRVRDLLNEIDALRVPADELQCVDPELLSLFNVNREDEYLESLRIAGFEASAGDAVSDAEEVQ
ncbi:MAG TPA: molybdenum cofactor guanylyltransferase [Lacipirellulaceae bacterium]|jgi:molybdopterin-guanine dinucleotide biosynthesis protein A|nr:molybdenum cofactor guanylyltransferase [Lacipirellulaceae bacterium]